MVPATVSDVPRARVADVVVVGGGISGLATAYWLTLEAEVDLVVVEASERAGGKVSTRTLGGMPVDTGPDAFLSRAPDLALLVSGLGLADDVVQPRLGGAFIWSRGRLRPIPPGGSFGIPDRVLPLVLSRLLSPMGVARAGLDLVRPRTTLGIDPTVAEVVRPRLGDEVVERLVQPLLGGVHAGSVERLSARSTVPDVVELARSGRSIVLGLRRRRRAAVTVTTPPAPRLVSLRGGFSRLVDALVDEIGEDRVVRGAPVTDVLRSDAGWEVVAGGSSVVAREVVLAAPAHAIADLLSRAAPAVAAELRCIEYVDVATVTLALPRAEVGELVGTGFLVPPAEGTLLVGCTWLTSKWPQLADGDCVLLRCMVGRDGDDRWTSMTDDELVSAVRADLARVMGVTTTPTESLVQRWPRAIPQYLVGHADRLDRLDRMTPEGLHLTGAAYRGSGLAGCVASARRTAAAVAGRLASSGATSHPDVRPDQSPRGAAP